MTKRILFVDDEPRILEALDRQLRKQFELQTAVGPEQGLSAIANGTSFAVVVSDLRMPGMDGITFLSRVRQMAPTTVRIILTGNADLSAAITAVNEGRIFQFLTKPCPADMLARALATALEQYRLITAERELLEQTLQGSIGVLIEILSLVNPAAFSRTHRIRRYVRHMAEQLRLSDLWQYELAATLSQIGCVVVPAEIIERSNIRGPLGTNEQQILASQGEVGRRLLAKIPRLETVARMIGEQGRTGPAVDPEDQVHVGAHLLRVALDFDEQILQGKSLGEALGHMRRNKNYYPKFIDALRRLPVDAAASQIQLLNLSQLKAGMIVAADLYSKTGLLLLANGHEITDSAIARIESFASLFGIAEPISVSVPGQPVSGVEDLDLSDTVAGMTSQFTPRISPSREI